MNRIVTIGREFGSGGRELGRRLSEIMGMAYYDKEIVTEIAKRTSMSEEYVQHIIEHRPVMSYPISIGRSFYPMVNPITDQHQTIYQEQHRIIREMAEKCSHFRKRTIGCVKKLDVDDMYRIYKNALG